LVACETLPPAAELLDPTSKLRTPSSGKLASVQNIFAWHQHKANLHAQDLQTARDKINGSSAVKHREASRLISTSMPYATAWHSVPPDGTTGTKIATPQWRASMQRQLGLHLSDRNGRGSCRAAGRFLQIDRPVPARRPGRNRLGRAVPAQEPGSNRRTTLGCCTTLVRTLPIAGKIKKTGN
jgi:hypothetical protein